MFRKCVGGERREIGGGDGVKLSVCASDCERQMEEDGKVNRLGKSGEHRSIHS